MAPDAGRGLIPLAFRFHVSMLCALGIGGNLLHWSTEELDEAAFWENQRFPYACTTSTPTRVTV